MSGMEFRRQMEAISGDVLIRVNSPGGNVWECAAMLQTVSERRKTARVDAVVDGLAGSGASALLMVCGHVTCASLGSVFIHRSQTWMRGDALAFRAQADFMENNDKSLVKLYGQRMKKDADEIMELMSRQTFFAADDALEHGLVDEEEALPEPDSKEGDETGETQNRMTVAQLQAKRERTLMALMS